MYFSSPSNRINFSLIRLKQMSNCNECVTANVIIQIGTSAINIYSIVQFFNFMVQIVSFVTFN